MRENPANKLGSTWDFLKDGKHEANIPALKDAVYTLIGMATQMDGGERPGSKGIPFMALDTVKMVIICEATVLVLSGKLDGLEKEGA